MENLSMRDLIIGVGGNPRPGETPGKYLYRVHKISGLKLRTLKAGWYEESNGSLQTRTVLKEKATNNADNLASTIGYLEATASEAEMAGRPPDEVRILRAAARALRDGNLSAHSAEPRKDGQ